MYEQSELDRLLRRLDELATAGHSVALHIRSTTPLMLFRTFADAWVRHYESQGYALRDSVTAWAYSQEGRVVWSSGTIADPWGIQTDAKRFGLNYGATFSIGPLDSRSIVSVARGDRDLREDELDEIEIIVRQLHEMTEPPKSLTSAQVEALRLIAAGYRHEAAAARIGISVSALKARLNAARRRLMARTTAEAIQRAKAQGLM